jgi:hypothetical protein
LLSTVGLGKYLSPALFNTTLYLVLTILPLILLIFWLVRVRFTNAYKGKSMPLTPTSPSMRRPVDVKAHFDFLLSVSLLPFSQAASVAILPSALFCERFSLGAHWVFSFQ